LLSVKHFIRRCHIKSQSGKRGELIDQGIIEYLAGQDWPVTTEMVAAQLGVSWNTAQMHLYKLMAGGLVKGRRIGRQNQWIISREKRQDRARKKHLGGMRRHVQG